MKYYIRAYTRKSLTYKELFSEVLYSDLDAATTAFDTLTAYLESYGYEVEYLLASDTRKIRWFEFTADAEKGDLGIELVPQSGDLKKEIATRS